MTDFQQILEELKEIKQALAINQPVNGNHQKTFNEMGVKEAAPLLGFSPGKLRSLCQTGIIPAKVKNPWAKNKHFLIDIIAARKILIAKGFLFLNGGNWQTIETRGRKPGVKNHDEVYSLS